MSARDVLQPGVYHRSGEQPPPCYRLLTVDVGEGAAPADVRDALERLFALVGGFSQDAALYGEVAVLIGYGRRLFAHDPPLTGAERPAYLAALDENGPAFPAIPWARMPPVNRGEADLAFQLTGPCDASVDCAAVELCDRVRADGLPLVPGTLFSGFGRPDRRGWLGFHDGVSNLESSRRPAALEAGPDPAWMAGGTYMAFLRLNVDLAVWRTLADEEQERLVGRDKATGWPPDSDRGDEMAFRDPPETTTPALELSHIHRANQSRASPDASAALRIFRQGYDFLAGIGPDGPELGLNFVSFQCDLATLQHLLHAPGWLGDVNFGGPAGPEAPSFISLADGGFYAVPRMADPFPGAELFDAALLPVPRSSSDLDD